MPRMYDKFTIWNLLNQSNMIILTHINKEQNHMILSINAEKEFDKIQHSFMTNTLNKIRIEENFLNQIECLWNLTFKNSQPHLLWNTDSLFLKISNKIRMFILTILINIMLELLAREIRQDKEIKGIKTRKKKVKLSLFADCIILTCKIFRNPPKNS